MKPKILHRFEICRTRSRRARAHIDKEKRHAKRDLHTRGWIGEGCVTYEQNGKEIADFVCPQNAANREAVWHYALVVNRRRLATYKQMMSLFGILRD